LANVYQFSGYEIIREYYINDRGGQITSLTNSIASLINSVYPIYCQYFNKDTSGKMKGAKEEYILSKASQEIAQKLAEKWHDKYLNGELKGETFDI
jgi:arginyl-tRNA synthetase